MRFSKLLCPTLKENPSEAEVISHQLMLRGGMIRQLASGIYSVLPVGLRVLRKIENIIREEMNRAGAQEVYLPAIQPAELWKESGRWDVLGKELLRIQDRHKRDCCFGPTHEEVITDLVRREIRSYRDLPKTLYQIQVKFRDEVRPRFGLMRCREFTMKDAYSFDVDEAQAKESYKNMHDAYVRIFTRCGLDFRAVEADSGNIGGSLSEEFMVLANSGEDKVISCASCNYAANIEKATSRFEKKPLRKESSDSGKKKMATPGKKSAQEVADFLKVPLSALLKTMIYKTEKGFVAALVTGDREVNEVKLKRYLDVDHLELAKANEILKLTGSPMGFAGPVKLALHPDKIARLVVDTRIQGHTKYVTGANELDAHLTGVIAGKDFSMEDQAEIHTVKADDECPKCGSPLRLDLGIEVGHIFMLGTKYSEAMKALYTDPQGKLHPCVMGCYGIGVGRTAVATIEQNHDERGMIFPKAIAPFDVYLVPVNFEKKEIQIEAEKVYQLLEEAGWETLLDDRNESVGTKFKDADLLGIPFRVTIGDKGLSQGKVEVKARSQRESQFIEPKELVSWLKLKKQA